MDSFNYVKGFDLFGVKARQIPCLTGKGEPTANLALKIGLLYINEDNGDMYKCINGNGEEGLVWVLVNNESNDSGQNVSLYIGPEEPIGENRPLYWLDTSIDDVPVVPEEPDVPVEPEPDPEPKKTLTGITVKYTGGSVPVGTAVSALTDVTVTASYSDGSTEDVTGYTMSGSIAEGSNTVTVAYHDKTATFAVTGVAASGGEDLPDDGMTTYHIPDVATSSDTDVTNYTVYTVENVKPGDSFRVIHAELAIAPKAFVGDGITLTANVKTENNYTDVYAELTVDASYETLTIQVNPTKVAEGYDCWWKHNPDTANVWAIYPKLTNVTINNEVTRVEEGAGYTTKLTPNNGYKHDIVTVIMCSDDITEDAYKDGIIDIPAVTGTVKITATACAENVYYLDGIASEITVQREQYRTYKVEGIKAGDIVRLACVNGDSSVGWSDGTTGYPLNDATFWDFAFMDNYAWRQATWTADKDYDVLWLTSLTNKVASNPASRAHIEKAVN